MTVKRVVGLEELLHILVPQDADIKKEIVPELGRQFRRNMVRQFASEGVSGGSRWAPLSSRYERWKVRRYPGRKILTRKGDLRNSLTHESDAHHVERYEHGSLFLGTTHPVGEYHAFGTGKMPKRNPLQHAPDQVKAYIDAISTWYRKRVDRIARIYKVVG